MLTKEERITLLTSIAENQITLYNTAYQRGNQDALNNDENYNLGIEIGKKQEYDSFWDAFQDNGKRTSYSYAFTGACWNDITFKPKYKFVAQNINTYQNMFRGNTGLSEIDCRNYFETSTTTTPLPNTGYMFYGCSIRKVIFDLKGFSAFAHMFRDSQIEEIILYNFIHNVDRTFEGCTKLNKLRIMSGAKATNNFDLSSSPLDKESILNVFEYLSPNASGKTVKFKLNVINSVFETIEGANDGSTSEEWNTLVNTKTNWTVGLI